MTGVFSSDVESYCNSTPFDGRMLTWGKRLQDAGYHTWATGKLDICGGKDIGFEQEDTSHGHWSDPDITSLFRAPVGYRAKERENANGSYSDRPPPDRPLPPCRSTGPGATVRRCISCSAMAPAALTTDAGGRAPGEVRPRSSWAITGAAHGES